MIDSSIIDSCKKRERKAFKQCYEACAPYVYSIIKNYIYEHHDRKDAMQEVFIHIFHSIHNFDPERGDFKSWIARITVNQTINILKKQNKIKTTTTIGEECEALEDPTDANFMKINKAVLQGIIENMPVGYRTVFLLFFIEGYTHSEIAQILDISNQTSRSQLSRAVKWIKMHCKKLLGQIHYG